MTRSLILLFALWLLSVTIHAQISPQYNSAEILLQIKKLNTVGSVLYIAAHPDDENTRLLGFLAKEKKFRAGYLSLTRGDGGQNLVGKEQGDALGLIRTQELLAARRVDGAEQFFTRANDFGYSKTPEETMSIWNKDSVLADVVWVIRNFKPDVIICRFPTTGEGGHGHHTASALLALEAFDAAADKTKFPEQLTYVNVWKTKRIFWNTFNFGTTNTTAPDQLKLDVGVFDPLLGKSFGEIASESRSMHKSQGFGSAKGRGASIEYFKLLKGDSVKTDLFEGIDNTWKRFSVTSPLSKLLDDCIKKYDPTAPEKSLPELIDFYKQLKGLPENDPQIAYWKKIKLKEAENLLLACSGLWMEAYTTDRSYIPGQTATLNVQVIKRNNGEAKLNTISYWGQSDSTANLNLKTNELYVFKHKEQFSSAFPFSNPYWLYAKHESSMFKVSDQKLIGTPENLPIANVIFQVELAGLPLSIERGLVYKYVDPVKGELYQPTEMLPPATVNISDKVFVFSDAGAKQVQFVVKANAPNTKGTLEVKVPDGWEITIKNNSFDLINKNDEMIIEASIKPGKNNVNGKLNASLLINGNAYSKSIKRIEYDHIPYQFILSDAEASLVNIDLKKTGTTIGYIPGAGDDIPACLKQIGYNVTILNDDLLSNEPLSKYNAIITGVRAYNTTERLQVHYNKLMDYVSKGGNLIVQYNTNNRIGPVVAKIGPYPFTISRDRVTDEKAEVQILKPAHPVLNVPNKIIPSDFDGWIQERGIYFASELDKNYETIFSMKDPNEKASEGSLIIAKHGKGNFVYTGLVFFRELPAGVPGAYRLLANLLSLPQNK